MKGRRIVSAAAIIAVAVNTDGRREITGVHIGPSEAERFWTSFLRDLMTMNVLNAVAQFERDRQIERTQSGLKRAKSEGKPLGRPFTLSEEQKQATRNELTTGMNVSAITRKFATSRQTIMRVRDEGSRSVRP